MTYEEAIKNTNKQVIYKGEKGTIVFGLPMCGMVGISIKGKSVKTVKVSDLKHG